MFSALCRAAVVAALMLTLPYDGHALALRAAQANAANDRELARLDAAARQYRVQVYETYRLDRAEFDRRRAAGDQAIARWREAGGRKEDLSAALRWLEQATFVSQPEVRQPLPGLPAFGPSHSVGPKTDAGADAPERIAPADAHRSVRETIPEPPAPVNREPYVQRRPPPAPKLNGYEIAPPRQFAPPATAQSVITPPSARPPARAQGGPAPSATQPRVGRALLPAPWEVVTPAPSGPITDPGVVQRRGAEVVGRAALPTRVERPSRTPGAAKGPERAATVAAPVPPLQPSIAINAGPKPTRIAAETTAAGNLAETLADSALPPRTPAAARPKPRGSGELNPPSGAVARSPRVALAKPRVARSAEGVSTVLATSSQPEDLPVPPASRLNVGELLARASGYGFELRTIDSVLHDQSLLETEQLAQLLGELEALVEQRGDLMLYEQLVSAEVRQRLVRAIEFPQTTVAALGSRIAAARERLSQESGMAANEREVRLHALAELSKRLSRLSQ